MAANALPEIAAIMAASARTYRGGFFTCISTYLVKKLLLAQPRQAKPPLRFAFLMLEIRKIGG